MFDEGDERIGAVIDVEHGAVRALEQHALAVCDLVGDVERGVGDVRAQPLGVQRVLVADLVEVDRRPAVDLHQLDVALLEQARRALAEVLGIEQVDDAQLAARTLVLVVWSDAAAGGADLLGTEALLARDVSFAVHGGQVRALVDLELRRIGQVAAPGSSISRHHRRVDHHPVADAAGGLAVQDAGRDEMHHGTLARVADDQRVASVVAALEARHHVACAANRSTTRALVTHCAR
jgi:hypothetical protein